MERNIKLLALFNFFISFIFYAPVAIIYFSQVSGSYALGMSIFAIVMLAAALFEVPTGIFSDLIGRKNTVIAGAFSSILSAVFYAIGGTYGALVIGATLEGLGRSFYSGNNDALLHDTLTETNQSHKYHIFLGKLTSAEHMGLALIAVLGSVLASRSFALVMWLSVLPKIFCLIISFFLIEPRIHSQKSSNVFAHFGESLAQFRLNRRLRLLSVASMIRFALGETVYQFRAVFVNSIWPLWAVGITTMLSNIGAAISYYFSGKVINKVTPKKALIGEILINRAINLVALVFPTIVSPALMSASSLSYGLGQVATNMLLQKEFTSQQRATMGSLNSLFGSIGFAVVAVGLGLIGDFIGPTKTLIIVHLLLLTPIIFYREIFNNEK